MNLRLVALSIIFSSSAIAQTTYSISDFGNLSYSDGLWYSGVGNVISNSGQVVSSSNNQAVILQNGSATYLGNLNGQSTGGLGISNNGQVTGTVSTNSGYSNAMIYSSGVMTNIGTLSGGYDSEGFGINNSGAVTGISSASTDSSGHIFYYANGVMSDLGDGQGLAIRVVPGIKPMILSYF